MTDPVDDNVLFQVFVFMRTMMAGKLLQLYLRSKNSAYEHKRESYVLFKVSLQQLMADDGLGLMAVILTAFLRLMRRAKDRMPRMDRIAKLIDMGSGKMVEVKDIQEFK